MPTPIDRHEVQRLLAAQDAQLVEVLPPAEYADALARPRHMRAAFSADLHQPAEASLGAR
jgi:hypothetical protein